VSVRGRTYNEKQSCRIWFSGKTGIAAGADSGVGVPFIKAESIIFLLQSAVHRGGANKIFKEEPK